jgi:hypothetical protein
MAFIIKGQNENYRREPHLILKIEGNRLTGHGGCNSFK